MPTQIDSTVGNGASIRTLPALLVNQIAAGEVVERPASVVKELVENSIDAGATRIAVDLEQGGVELVRVTDDGRAVPLDEARLMVAPHATSKLRAAADLDSIATMGFRGEALASIASVSRMSIRSRPRDAEAWRLDAEGDRIGEPRPDSAPHGASVSVRSLFFNTPARRKFLRTPATEQTNCLDVVRDLALAHPRIAFRATADGRVALDLPGDQTPRDRLLDVLGRELEPQLVDVSADEFDDARSVTLWGMVGLPTIARATARAQRIFVRGRSVRDKTIQHALREAFRGLIEPGRYPTAVLLIDMPPGAVDVNVHPAKAEVRFRDSGLVHSVVLRAVKDALRRADLTPGLHFARPGNAPNASMYGDRGVLPTGHGADSASPITREHAARAFVDYFNRVGHAARSGGAGFEYAAVRSAVDAARAQDALHAPEASPPGTPAPRPSPAGAPEPNLPGATARPADRVLQVHNSFLVTQDEQGIVIVDQHALHERVMFEAISARLAQGPLESQRLLTPALVSVPAAQAPRLEELKPTLARLGIDAAPIGPETIAVHAFPTFLFDRGVEPAEFLGDLLDRIEGDGFAAGQEEALHEVVDMMACKAAVKAGDRLSDDELGALMDLRAAVERSSNCPHGRPTTIRLSIRDLERRFGRS